MKGALPIVPEIQNDGDMQPGGLVAGYRLERIAALEEVEAVFHELTHGRTGARHIHIAKDDGENTFAVAFKTVPSDSTGVAHILEHTALCGSRRFPVRDPFFSMLKRSLSTFMNAFTASDWTMYPFSTQNRKDFYNLLDVYLDAAFFPNLGELNFKQEGHRLEMENDGPAGGPGGLVYKGVVYNEMKGAMSSPDQVFGRSLLNALYPDTTYRFNSGGDPAESPRLTHDQLVAFHRRHYHPSNAFFYTYGDLPLEEHLRFIDARVLSRFERIDPGTEVPSQPRWQAPRRADYAYPIGAADDPADKHQAAVAWLTADVRDTFEVLVLVLLEQVLMGNPASPLRKALIDSGLGTALCDAAGFEADNRDTLFTCGLKGVKASAAPEVEKIVFGVLGKLADRGIDRELIESAIHQIEFRQKEVTNTPYPYGIKMLLAISATWFHGGDPVRILNFDRELGEIRRRLEKEPFFENRIRRHFLDNPHRVLFTLSPDPDMEREERRRVAEELREIKARLSRPDLERIVRDARALRQEQERQEDISCLPTLQLADIPPDIQRVTPSDNFPRIPGTCYPQPTSGVFYVTAAMGCGHLEQRLMPLVPFFCHAFTKAGTALSDYVRIARRIDRCTGGLGMAVQSRTRFGDGGGCLPFVSFNGKCLYRNQEQMFTLVEELLLNFGFEDLVRLKTLLLEYRAALEAMVVQNGHRLAMMLAARNLAPASALAETWHGVHQLQTIKKLCADTGGDALAALAEDLRSIGRRLIRRNNLKAALVAEARAVEAAAAPMQALVAGMDDGAGEPPEAGFVSPPLRLGPPGLREGWSTATAVSFVARVFPAVGLLHRDAPVLAVIAKMLRSLYLHREIREKGGAYGGFAIYNPEDGLFSLGSYRDPHVVSTLEVYDGVAGFATAGKYTDEDVKEAILQVCSEIDKPSPPGQAARKDFQRRIVGLTDEDRLRFKQRLLAASRSRVLEVAETYFRDPKAVSSVAVISGDEKLQAANAQLGGAPLALARI